jgi:hypothetical protein
MIRQPLVSLSGCRYQVVSSCRVPCCWRNRSPDAYEHAGFVERWSGASVVISSTKGLTMKFMTVALASALALSSTFALAQTSAPGAGTETPAKSGPAMKGTRSTGNSMNSGASSGSAITTGSGAPQNKPMISNSPETSDTSQKVK